MSHAFSLAAGPRLQLSAAEETCGGALAAEAAWREQLVATERTLHTERQVCHHYVSNLGKSNLRGEERLLTSRRTHFADSEGT